MWRKQATNKTMAATPGGGDASLEQARNGLANLAERENSIDALALVLLALDETTDLVTVRFENEDLITVPDDLLTRTFNDPDVGVSDEQMPSLLTKVTSAIADERVEALVHEKLLNPPTAALVILDVCDMIQFWIDNPDETVEENT